MTTDLFDRYVREVGRRLPKKQREDVQTELHSLLRRHAVRRLFVMGLATDYCVQFTVLDAIRLGYETHLIKDGCRGVGLGSGDVENAIEAMRDAGAYIVHSDDVPRLIDTGAVMRPHSERESEDRTIAETPHLRLVRRGNWDYVTRTTGSGVVAIVAVTANDELVLVEQHRPPLACDVIELPAGLVGDIETARNESFEAAAARELDEETGYRAESLRCVMSAASSGGLTDEKITFVMATGLQRIHDGGGDATESITVRHVPLTELDRWLQEQSESGRLIDARVLTGIYLLQSKW